MQNSKVMQEQISPREIIEGLAQSLCENYVFPELAQQIAATLRQRLADGAYDGILDADQLAKVITEHLYELSHDKHLRLFYRPEGVSEHIREDQSYPAEEIERIRVQGIEQSFYMKKVEILEGNIGYFRFDRFMHPYFAGENMQAAMTFLAHTRALIIDLRYNGGGDSSMVQFLCSYFFAALEDEQVQLTGIYERKKDLLRQQWVMPYVPGPRYLQKPLYVLTSQNTFSGAEDFSYTLQQLKRAYIVGERTKGGANPGFKYPITVNFETMIPSGRSINPISGTNWEGTGVTPDLAVAAEEALDVAYRRAAS
ncbi:hypothetical protein EPA93_12965 [Ktedonosporobacter rubrisoli]|uniref:Tail specific protease domain-containing protein n=1 Tax=Ktedonosporobacter rubrisoli TaxID=2509675 RepID=A0A4P6JNP3_KTERU|nr:S41 family peptidase [Ktedonosporobacter rubrisoli]QBD76865.1 hypothetical protein EPA93_12965 [Ktedonosporobacter rubrisoli]